MTVEFWTTQVAAPRRAARQAVEMEQAGWTGIATVDSQNLSGDPYLFLGLAAAATESLGVMTSVTNPVTRHPSVTASSAMSVQHLSNGRMVLGIGRGDSALAYLGRAPARLGYFEDYLRNVRTYLHLGDVAFDDCHLDDHIARPLDSLELADQPDVSAVHWARTADVAPVPIEVAATGPKIIGMAARHADRILFALGADPDRVQWGIDTARAAAEAAGRDPSEVAFGAYVNVVCEDDVARARDIGRAGTSLFARFSVMHGEVSGPASNAQHEVFQNVRASYDMNKHARGGSKQSEQLTDEFLDSFAIMGSESLCVDRLNALVDLGVDKFCVSGAPFGARDPELQEISKRVIRDVAPQVG
ncbi:MAG: LLM class flavin-dependent oxidoreductase [Actinomycetota bacterium]